MDEYKFKELEKKAAEIRRLIVRMVGVGRQGHLGGSCSIADIVAFLYFGWMKTDPANPRNEDRDRFILSKGHAAIAQYAALAMAGYFPAEELDSVKKLGAMLQGHPDANKTPGVEANTGSLGQGLSIGNGMALALRLNNSPRRVYVMIGDGEIAEGQIWEAAMAASNFRIDNLTAFVDKNNLQAMGAVAERFDTNPLIPKWRAFGWHAVEIDGHDFTQIAGTLNEAVSVKGKPTVIIANTVKGKGVSFAENKIEFHNGVLTKEQYGLAMDGLKEALV